MDHEQRTARKTNALNMDRNDAQIAVPERGRFHRAAALQVKDPPGQQHFKGRNNHPTLSNKTFRKVLKTCSFVQFHVRSSSGGVLDTRQNFIDPPYHKFVHFDAHIFG